MRTVLCVLLMTVWVGAQTPSQTVGQIVDRDLTMLDRELVPLAEAMPAERYVFAPTGGEFKGVRTFGQQVSHVAAVLYAVSAAAAEEKNPSEMGPGENGPPSLKTKADIVKYLKDALAYSHKAMAKMTNQNSTDLVVNPFGPNKVPRLKVAYETVWHSFDHYGQMVVYLRMNGIVPPASR